MADTSKTPRPRLTIEVTARTDRDLQAIIDYEELNKTTAINRAVQVYRLLMDAQAAGKTLAIVDPTTGVGETLRLI